MAEQKCDIFEARKILGIGRGKSYAAIVREKNGGIPRTNQRKDIETNSIRREPEENAITTTRTQTRKNTNMDPSPRRASKEKEDDNNPQSQKTEEATERERERK